MNDEQNSRSVDPRFPLVREVRQPMRREELEVIRDTFGEGRRVPAHHLTGRQQDGDAVDVLMKSLDASRRDFPADTLVNWSSAVCPTEVTAEALEQWIRWELPEMADAERDLSTDPDWKGSDLQAAAGTDCVRDCYDFLELLSPAERGVLPGRPVAEFSYAQAVAWLETVLANLQAQSAGSTDADATVLACEIDGRASARSNVETTNRNFAECARPQSQKLFRFLQGRPGMRADRRELEIFLFKAATTPDALRKAVWRLDEDLTDSGAEWSLGKSPGVGEVWLNPPGPK